MSSAKLRQLQSAVSCDSTPLELISPLCEVKGTSTTPFILKYTDRLEGRLFALSSWMEGGFGVTDSVHSGEVEKLGG